MTTETCVEVQDLNYGKVKELEKRAAHGGTAFFYAF
jgi:hypothetical protein